MKISGGSTNGKGFKMLVISNPHSERDKHRGRIPHEIKLLEESGIDFIYVITERAKDELDLAYEGVKLGFKCIIASGGDSTISNVSHAILEKNPNIIFGVLPNGTGNDFAQSNKLPLNLHEALEIIKAGYVEQRDVLKIGDRYAANLIGTGFDITMSEVHLNNKVLKGAFLYYYAIIVAIFTHKSADFTLTAPGVSFKGKSMMINFGNGDTSGGGYRVCPKANNTDGKLDLMYIEDCPPFKRLNLLTKVQKGTHINDPIVHYAQVKKVEFTSSEPIAFHTEGEMFYTNKKKLTVELIPKRLKLLCRKSKKK